MTTLSKLKSLDFDHVIIELDYIIVINFLNNRVYEFDALIEDFWHIKKLIEPHGSIDVSLILYFNII